MIKTRLVLAALAILVAIALSGCGGGSSSGSSSSGSSSGPASLAPPGSLVYVEGKLKPSGSLKSNANSIASILTGDNSLGDFVVSELESSARADGESFDFAEEVEPWLGETGGVAFKDLEKDGDLSEPLIAIQTTNAKATGEFIDKRATQSNDAFKDSSYEGIDFKVGGSEGNAIGVIGEYLVIADGEPAFKAAVNASGGDSLADEDRFDNAIAAASDASLADVYVDVGGLIKQSGDRIDPEAKELLENAGIDPSEATAVASVVPSSEQIEIDLSSDLGGEEGPSGDASELLGSLPTSSVAAFAFTDFNAQLEEAIDNLDASGIPPNVKPHELKKTLSQAGVDLSGIVSSFEDAGVFVEGNSKGSLGGALVLTSGGSNEAAKAIADFSNLLRSAGVEGVTAVSGKASGFSIRSPELGRKPIVFLAKGSRIAVGYGLAETLKGFGTGSGETLSGSASYKAAVSSLGDTPISAFVDGPAALRLAESLVPRSETDFWEARPYLGKLSYIGLGTGTDGELATAKLIAGLEK